MVDIDNMERAQIEAKLHELRHSVLPILEYSQRELRDHTTHGYMHSDEVEKLLVKILSRCNEREARCNIGSIEEYLLICAAWLHDIGNIVGRNDHNRITCDIIDQLTPDDIWGLDPDCIEFVKWLCLAHSRSYRIEKVPARAPFRGTEIRLRYLTAVFRIADAADMNSKRAPIAVYEIIKANLPKVSRQIWRSHQAVRDVSFLPSNNFIIVTVSDKRRASRAVKEFIKEHEEVKDVLEAHEFPYTDIRVVREDVAPYRGRRGLT